MRLSLLSITCVILLAGCASTGVTTVNAPVENTSQVVTDAPAGLIQRTGVPLSPNDVAKALQAEQYALSTAPAGEVVNWQGRDARGSVTAASPYQVGEQNCRQYTQRIIVNGVESVARGAACRDASGRWALLT